MRAVVRRLFKRPAQDYRVLYRHRWLTLCAGYMQEPYLIASPGVLVVPVDEAGHVLFINEPARTNAELMLSLPGGAWDQDESTADSANRELQEEAGYRAGRLDFLGALQPLGRHAVWEIHTFLGRDLTPGKLPGDEGYEITVERFPLDHFEALIESERLLDATLIAALYMARHLLANEAQQVPGA